MLPTFWQLMVSFGWDLRGWGSEDMTIDNHDHRFYFMSFFSWADVKRESVPEAETRLRIFICG